MQERARTVKTAERAAAAQDVVYRWLKQHVLTLPRQSGTFLTEAEVSRATGASRTPVREAFLRLESEGFLQILPKKGAFVPPIGEAEIESVMQARELVEDWCLRQAMRLGEPFLEELDELLRRQGELQHNPIAFIECDREFHRALVRAGGNPVLAAFYESLRDRQIRMGIQAIVASKQRVADVLAEHAAIVEAVRSKEGERAVAAMAAHLRRTLMTLRGPAIAAWTSG